MQCKLPVFKHTLFNTFCKFGFSPITISIIFFQRLCCFDLNFLNVLAADVILLKLAIKSHKLYRNSRNSC